jgi:Tol biopolymer transport system component
MFRWWVRLAAYAGGGSVLAALLTVAVPRQQPGVALEYREIHQHGKIVMIYYVDIEHGIRSHQQVPAEVERLQPSDSAPDGRRVIPLSTPGNIDLFLLTPDANRLQLTHFSNFPPLRAGRDPRRANLYPIWSPDAAWIVFLSSDEVGHLDLYAVRPDGQEMRRLAYHINTEEPVHPRWVRFKSG